jgi:lipoprotein-anchoring transpeptidase ErfK/SrfK
MVLCLLACLALTGALAAPALADDTTAIIGPGTVVAGVDLSGLSVAAATPVLKAQLAPKVEAPVTATIAGRTFTLAAKTAKVKLDALRTARRAFYASREAAGPTAVSATPAEGGAAAGLAINPALTYSKSAVQTWANGVAAQVAKPGRDAKLKVGLTRMRITHATRGRGIDAGALAAAVDAALADPTVPRTGLTTPLVSTKPTQTTDTLRARFGTILTVDRSHFKLRLFKRLRLVKTYGIAVGMAGLDTPSGSYHITNKAVNPAWHVPMSAWAGSLAGSVIPGGAPNNPLVARWLGIQDGVGIHGTNEPWSIGSAASHGCIRMRPEDVIDLYPRVPVGTTVLIG